MTPHESADMYGISHAVSGNLIYWVIVYSDGYPVLFSMSRSALMDIQDIQEELTYMWKAEKSIHYSRRVFLDLRLAVLVIPCFSK